MTTTDQRNAETSRQEVESFMKYKPQEYFGYQSHDVTVGHLRRHDIISTWTGDKLAEVVEVKPPYVSNLGDKRQSFRARGINGVTYSGTAYLSAGDYVRMRAVKA